MKFVADHDYHIHSFLSLCSDDPKQTPENILRFWEENGAKKICLTDHLWDLSVPGCSGWYEKQPIERGRTVLPLPQGKNTEFFFGAETDMDKFGTVGISRAAMDTFDFIIIPTTHLHMEFTIAEEDRTVEGRRRVWIERFDHLLSLDLPFHKIGVAHLTCPLVAPASWEEHVAVFAGISEAEYRPLFRRAAKLGVGIELNMPFEKYVGEDAEILLRPYRVAKEEGCLFYLGSDAHHPDGLAKGRERFAGIIDALDLTEDQKFSFR